MYDYLTEDIWKELGHVEPDWFQVLSARASSKEEHLSDSDDQELCPNQEANFKTPLRKNAQTFSTPRALGRGNVASPNGRDQQEKGRGARSPALFGLAKDTVPPSNSRYGRPRTPNFFDLLHTPQASPMAASSAQHISESLGADVHPDISWSSSLNTPPALPSTLTLSTAKTDASPSAAAFSVDQSAVLVRKLFPSLSNQLKQAEAPPQSNDPLLVLKDADSPEVHPHPTCQTSGGKSPEHSHGILGRQPEDGAAPGPAACDLDCPKDSLSLFFDNGASVIGKAKNHATKHGSGPSGIPTESKPVVSEQAEPGQELCVKHPGEIGDSGLTQWSPSSLSDFPATAVAAQQEAKSTTQAESPCDSGPPVRASLNSAGFTKKRTKFIYTVDKAKLSKINSLQECTQMPNANDKAELCNISDGKEELDQRDKVPKENLPSLLGATTQDLGDMSQLCRAFAQDFSQMSYPGAPPKASPPHLPAPSQGFSPSACLTALKVVRMKAKKQGGLYCETALDKSVGEVTGSDSGFLSASADISHVTVSCGEKHQPSHQWTSGSPSREKSRVSLGEVPLETYNDAEETSAPPRGSLKDSTQTLLSVRSENGERTQDIEAVSLDSLQVSGFKSPGSTTAGTRHCDDPSRCSRDAEEQISARSSSAQSGLLRVSKHNSLCPKEDHLAFDLKEPRQGLYSSVKQVRNAAKKPGNRNVIACQGEQRWECDGDADKDITTTSALAPLVRNCEQPNCQLTTSQKADVKELCTLLEETGSQFEFTQFLTVEFKQAAKEDSVEFKQTAKGDSVPAPKADKDLDPDELLSGIDFDDSFCAEANEKMTAMSCDRTGNKEPSVASSQTAEESVVRVYKKCLKKTKHLSEDLEEETPAHKQSVEKSRHALHEHTSQQDHPFIDSYATDEALQGFFSPVKPNQSPPKTPGNISCAPEDGFQMASGKQVFISPRAMRRANAIFKDCGGQHLVGIEPFANAVPSSSSTSTNFVSSTDVSAEAKENFSGNNPLEHGPSGFQKARGQRVAVSVAALKKSRTLLDDCLQVEEPPARFPPLRQSDDLLASGKSGSFSANFRFDDLGTAFERPSVSGPETRDTKPGNATSVEMIGGQKHPVENENLQTHTIGNNTYPLSEVDFSISTGGGFCTASGKKVSVSAVAMAKARHLPQEDHGDNPSTESKHGSSPSLEHTDHQPNGFQTARGKPVTVSSAALEKAKFLLDDCGEVKERPALNPPARKRELLSAHDKSVLFSDNLDRVSESLSISDVKDVKTVKAAMVENMDGQNYQVENEKVQNYNNAEKHATPPLDFASSSLNVSGFATASGKKVSVSAAAMKKAKLLLQEDNGGSPSTETKHVSSSSLKHVDHRPGGFQTAGGKRVTVSSAALKKAKFLLGDCDEIKEHADLYPPSIKRKIPSASEKSELFYDCASEDLSVSGVKDAKTVKAAMVEKMDYRNYQIGNENLPNYNNVEKEAAALSLNFTSLNVSGFATASGKKVSVSAAAVKKAKLLFQEEHGDDPSSNMKRGRSFGVECVDWTAGCEKANCDLNCASESPAAPLYDAKQGNTTSRETLDDCLPIAGATQKKTFLPNVATREAHGHLSDLLDCKDGMSGKASPSVSDVKTVEVNGQIENIQPHNNEEKYGSPSLDFGSSYLCGGGFSTASGKKLSVSAAAMAKAKDYFQEDHEHGLSTNVKHASFLGVECVDRHPGGFQTAGGKRVAVSSAALRKAKFLLDDWDSVEEHPAKSPKPGLSSQSPAVKLNDAKQGTATSKEKLFMGQKETSLTYIRMLEADDYHKDTIASKDERSHVQVSGSRFWAASGKSMGVSDQAMTKAKSLFSDIEGDTPKRHHNNKEACLPNVGFQTASDRRSSTWSADVKDAKSFFNEGLEDTTEVPHLPTSSSCGFSMASGKKVLVSDSAMARAKSLLDESVMSKDADFQTCVASNKASNPLSEEPDGKITAKASKIRNCGFSAANGKPVSVSTEAPQKAQALFDDVGFDERVQTDAQKTTFSVPSISGLSQGQSECLREDDGDLHQQEFFNASDREMDQTTEEPTIVNLQSLNLTDCTETQQLFLAQEALDCTKALLQDERLAGQSMTIESMQPENQEQTNGKRSAQATGLPEQPPSKRRLLDEFDRSLDIAGRPKCCPLTSSPDGLMKDRPAFKYNVSLGPIITRPQRDGKGYVEATASSKMNRQPSTVALTFLPPFFKETEAPPRRSNTKTPPAFVPPFKRQTTAVERSSAIPFKCNTKKPRENSEDPHATAWDQSMTNRVSGQSPPPPIRSWSPGTTPEKVQLARDMQDMRIRKKKRQTVRPLPGSLFGAKTSGATRIRLRDAVARRPPAKYTPKQLYEYGVHRHVCKITSETAEDFRFQLELFFKKEAFADEGGVQLADGGWLVPSGDGTAGKEHFYRALCDTPGVDPKLLSDEWVYNHYRWIVWKSASMERSFPKMLGGRCLTPDRVLLQLKYRYDVEVDRSRRPALRKITERDDTAAKTLVLCVCGVLSQGRAGNACAVVWLTDGWYAVKAQLDEPLSHLLRRGRLGAGGKLIIHGAQLAGSPDACAPLEAPPSLVLKVFANSSRPARWDTKLGFYRDPRPFLLPLSSLYSNGGPVGCVDIVVLRSYPVQWMERLPDGGVAFRSARAEEKEEARYSGRKQKAMEALYAKIQAEYEQEELERKRKLRGRTVSLQDIGGLRDGQELYEAVVDDLAGLEAHLSEEQLETLRAYGRSLTDKKQAEIQERYRRASEKNADDGQTGCPQRDVAPVWRLCVVDSLSPAGDIYQLSVWRPCSDLQELLKEGRRYKVYNLTASDRKKHGRVAALQLTATRRAQFQELRASPEWLSACFQPRENTDFEALQNLEFDPPCGEVDLTGCVVSVVDGQGPCPAFYLADSNVNFVKVRCFSSLLEAGLADLVKAGALLALSNLQLRGQSTRPTPVVYAGDLAVFSTNPKEGHLQRGLEQLRNHLRAEENFIVYAQDKLSQVLKCDVRSFVCSPALPPKTPPLQHTRTNTTPQQPIRNLGCFTPLSRNLHRPSNASSSDPRSLKKRRAVDFLSRVPSPPPLFVPPGLAASPYVRKTFNPPRRTSTPRPLKTERDPTPATVSASPPEKKEAVEWVDDHELAMIDTQALCDNAL